jgi:hypothetical protein
MVTIPNLIRNQPQAEIKRLYSAYLSRLMARGRYLRSVEASRQIRAYANRGRRPRVGDFTYQFEIDALCKLDKPGTDGTFSDVF